MLSASTVLNQVACYAFFVAIRRWYAQFTIDFEAYNPNEFSPTFHWTPFGCSVLGYRVGAAGAMGLAVGQAVLYIGTLRLVASVRGLVPDHARTWCLWLHNVLLCLFSGWITAATLAETLAELEPTNSSLGGFTCAPVNSERFSWLQLLWVGSKAWEWLDTVFLVLAGKQPIVLHLWHHASTMVMFLLMTPYSWGSKFGPLFNGTVHFVMYAHYAHPFPRWLRPWITRFQITQFMAALAVGAYSATYCAPHAQETLAWSSYWLGNVLCLTYLGLFIDYYRKMPKS